MISFLNEDEKAKYFSLTLDNLFFEEMIAMFIELLFKSNFDMAQSFRSCSRTCGIKKVVIKRLQLY